jgi:LPS-assembly protein
MQSDYYGLFRDNHYSGYDRIADANQITVGVSSGFLNAQGKERMRVAVALNFYLQQSKTTLYQTPASTNTRSSILGEFDVNFEGEYFFHAGADWDTTNDELKKANSTLEKRWLYNTYAQLSYRYIPLNDVNKQKNEDQYMVRQLGTKVNYSINTQWESFASYYYDLEYNRSYETIAGIKYQSCCWAVGLTVDEHMLAYYGALPGDPEREQSIKVTFELMGLGGVGFTSEDADGVFDYGRPFYLQ